MKQLPLIASTLYCTPWHIDAQSHAELGKLYRSYVIGEIPHVLDQGLKQLSSGVSIEFDNLSKIAVLSIEGIISKRTPDIACGPVIADLSRIDSILKQIQIEAEVETLIIFLKTPGGVGIGLQETSENIQDLIDSGVRVIAYADYLCASAGYWIAASCQEIYAAPSAQIGSIGTYMAAIDDSRAWEMQGLQLKLFRDGDLKGIGMSGKMWTQEEEDFLNQRVVEYGSAFKNYIRSRRKEIEDTSMRGQVFAAQSAPKGLVDGFYRDIESLIAALF